jgi:cell division cycle protein 37
MELEQLKKANKERQAKLDEYEKNKKWNVDNMFEVTEERTVVNPNAGKASYNPDSGFVVEEKSTTTATTASVTEQPDEQKDKPISAATPKVAAVPKVKPPSASKPSPVNKATGTTKHTTSTPIVGPTKVELGAMETYHEFTERNAETVEQFMACKTLVESREFLLKYGDILLCENASNYLLLASLEDEMNGERDKMKLTARQSQIVTNLAELAKTVHQHPGNVIQPFFARLQERKHLEEFLMGVNVFVEKIIQRAIVKKAEIDAQRASAKDEEGTTTDLQSVPREERLGPGGLDPLEVIETLPPAIVAAFESRDVEQLKEALQSLTPEDAEYHMQRCVASGLWVANS